MYPSKWTIRKNLKDQVYALIQQLCAVKNSKIYLKKCLYNTALSAQHTMSKRLLPLTIFIDPPLYVVPILGFYIIMNPSVCSLLLSKVL